jgi:hypothetical protein
LIDRRRSFADGSVGGECFERRDADDVTDCKGLHRDSFFASGGDAAGGTRAEFYEASDGIFGSREGERLEGGTEGEEEEENGGIDGLTNDDGPDGGDYHQEVDVNVTVYQRCEGRSKREIRAKKDSGVGEGFASSYGTGDEKNRAGGSESRP